MINKVIWCDRGWMPYHYGFCPNEAAWKREMKRLAVEVRDYPLSDGKCSHFVQSNGDNSCSIVTLGDTKGISPIKIIGMLYHEGVHVWQALREAIGEEAPSREFEAYTVQSIGENLIRAYEMSGRGILTSKKRICI